MEIQLDRRHRFAATKAVYERAIPGYRFGHRLSVFQKAVLVLAEVVLHCNHRDAAIMMELPLPY